jgi:hypothetical protein
LCSSIFLEYQASNLLTIYIEVEFLSHMVNPCLNYWAHIKPFSVVAAPFYIPTSNEWAFHIFHILINTFCVQIFCYYYTLLVNVVLIFTFIIIQWCWKFLHVFAGNLYNFFGESHFQILLIFYLIMVFAFLFLSCVNCF